MAKQECEYNCPYLKDPAIKGKCPTIAGLDPAAAIQDCAEKVSQFINNRPSRTRGYDRHWLPIVNSALEEPFIAGSTTRKLGVPQESDLEI